MKSVYKSKQLANRIRQLQSVNTEGTLNFDDKCEVYLFSLVKGRNEVVEQAAIVQTLESNLQSESVYALPYDSETCEVPSDIDAVGVPTGSRSQGLDGSCRPIKEIVNGPTRGGVTS
jgi:hypothetical protein